MTAEPGYPFDVQDFLESAGIIPKTVSYSRTQVILSQGDACDHVVYLRDGIVKVSVASTAGQEAVVALLRPGDFFGEGCLTGRALHTGTAVAATDCCVLLIFKEPMLRVLQTQHAMSARFIAHLLARNIRAEQDLADQLLHSSEQRLARALLLLAHFDKPGMLKAAAAVRIVPTMTQATLAQIVGTTRARINHFIKKFERLGYIDRRDGLAVHRSLFAVVDRDSPDNGFERRVDRE